MSEQDEIRQLEQENYRLRAMLARHGVSILLAVDLPDDAELTRLLEMVERAYQSLKCPPEIIATNKWQFANAIHWMAFAYRTDRVKTEYAASFWFDAYREWARDQGYSDTQMNLRPFTAAAIVSGVLFSPMDNYPYLSFGLSLGSVGQRLRRGATH